MSELTQKLDNLEKELLVHSEAETGNLWPFLLVTAGIQAKTLCLLEMCPLISNQDLMQDGIALDWNKVINFHQMSIKNN